MELIRAKVLGFCMGVRRAVNLALEETKRSNGKNIYTLGPLIHNFKVLDDLKRRGIQIMDPRQQTNPWDIVESPDPALNSQPGSPGSQVPAVIIRAHGISPEAEKELREKEYRIIDATCPNVKANQLKTEELSSMGYSLFLAGESNHAEIEGLLGYAETSPFCAVVNSLEEAARAAHSLCEKDHSAKTALIGQTTICEDEYRMIGDAIKEYFPNLEIINTICAATIERQQALRELLTEADAILIAGSKESANTRRLLAIAEDSGKPCVIIEDAREIPTPFRYFKKVGLCAGASTPNSLISEIELEFMR